VNLEHIFVAKKLIEIFHLSMKNHGVSM